MKQLIAFFCLVLLIFLAVYLFPGEKTAKQPLQKPVSTKNMKPTMTKCDGRVIETKSGKYCLRD